MRVLYPWLATLAPFAQLAFGTPMGYQGFSQLDTRDHGNGSSCPLPGPDLGTTSVLVARNLEKGWYDREEGQVLQAASDTNGRTRENLLRTLVKFTRKLDDLGYPWALGGGFALSLQNPHRDTTDIDIVVEISDVNKLRKHLTERHGYIVPQWERPGHLRLYYDLNGSRRCPKWIEIDVVATGVMGNPKRLRGHTVDIVVETPGFEKKWAYFVSMELREIWITKMLALNTPHRQKGEKDLQDIMWIMRTDMDGIAKVSQYVDKEYRKRLMKVIEDRWPHMVEEARKALRLDRSKSRSGGK